MAVPSILIITAGPDERRSTGFLKLAHDALRRRTDVEVETWFLRCAWNEAPWDGSRVVDDLRTWWPASMLDRLRLRTAASRLRGARLRLWLRSLHPDLIVLDDGLGSRLLTHADPSATVLWRINRKPPADALLESLPGDGPDAWLAPPGLDPPGPGPVLTEYETRDDWAQARHVGGSASRRGARARLQLPNDEPIVTGWGDSGWLDGPDVFIRCIWALEARHDIRAHGVWFGSFDDVHERDRLAAEARRCDLADRFHHMPEDSPDARLCGDAVLLPYRDAADDEDLLMAICAGSAVVTFPVTGIDDPSVRVVEHLDVEAAALELARALEEDRDVRWRETLRRLDLQSLLDELVQLAGKRDSRA